MKPINQIISQNPSVSTKPDAVPLPRSVSPEKATQIQILIRQCFDTLNVFGKTDDQFENIVKLFISVLADCDLENIRKAFVFWGKENSQMPTPADILAIAKGYQPHKASGPQHKVFRADPEDYARVRNRKIVPWHGKMWPLMDEDMRQQVIAHTRSLPKDRALDYCKFLKNHADAPADLPSLIFQ